MALGVVSLVLVGLMFGGAFVHKMFGGVTVAFLPVFSVSTHVLDSTASIFNFLEPKSSLIRENTLLKKQLDDQATILLRYKLLESENIALKKLESATSSQGTVAAVVRLPDSSPYDTLLIDRGENQGLFLGERVYTEGGIPVGLISILYKESALVKLFSSPGDAYDVFIGVKKISTKAYGRGGGNFEVILPHGTEVAVGDIVILPGISSKTFGSIESMTDKESGTFVQALFKAPFSFDELRFVVVMP